MFNAADIWIGHKRIAIVGHFVGQFSRNTGRSPQSQTEFQWILFILLCPPQRRHDPIGHQRTSTIMHLFAEASDRCQRILFEWFSKWFEFAGGRQFTDVGPGRYSSTLIVRSISERQLLRTIGNANIFPEFHRTFERFAQLPRSKVNHSKNFVERFHGEDEWCRSLADQTKRIESMCFKRIIINTHNTQIARRISFVPNNGHTSRYNRMLYGRQWHPCHRNNHTNHHTMREHKPNHSNEM